MAIAVQNCACSGDGARDGGSVTPVPNKATAGHKARSLSAVVYSADHALPYCPLSFSNANLTYTRHQSTQNFARPSSSSSLLLGRHLTPKPASDLYIAAMIRHPVRLYSRPPSFSLCRAYGLRHIFDILVSFHSALSSASVPGDDRYGRPARGPRRTQGGPWRATFRAQLEEE